MRGRHQIQFRFNSKTLQSLVLATIVVGCLVSTYLWTPLETSTQNTSSALGNALREFKGESISTQREPPAELPRYHVIFSTGCSAQQHWESYVFFYHAFKVQQPGNVTRLVSGCTPQDEKNLRQFHEEKIITMSDRFHVFFTPDFGKEGGIDKHYKYNNKPNSVHMWMKDILGMSKNNQSNEFLDDIVILMDPDMILLRPLLHDFSNQPVLYAGQGKKGKPAPQKGGGRVVKHGNPMAQQDGYLNSNWMKFNVSYISQGGSFPQFDTYDGIVLWNSGPPYLSTVKDMWNMASLWKDYVPRVYEEYPELFAEMYGLIIAAVQLKLPHTLVKSIVVSTTTSDNREGWEFVDDLPDSELCNVGEWSKNERMPIVLHYCKRYLLEKFFFSKYRLKKKFISCNVPLLTMPPGDHHKRHHYAVRPPPDRGVAHDMEIKNISARTARRENFMLCGLISSLNEASRFYKSRHCAGGGNTSEVYTFFSDPFST